MTGVQTCALPICAHADWFTNLAVDPVALHRRLGCTLAHTSLPKFMAACMQAPPPTTEELEKRVREAETKR